jgi:hypothetical protein
MPETINTIVEGCFPDTTHQLMYCSIELTIPENAKVLFSENSCNPKRYLLHAKTYDFSEVEILQNPYFKLDANSPDPNKSILGGWPLKTFEPNFNWILGTQRSLITIDGRIYVQATYFSKGFRSYLKSVSIILKECGEMFRGERDANDFCHNPSRRL